MDIIIIGTGKVGKYLVEHLVREGHNITIIDTNAKLMEDCVNIYDVKGVIGNGASYEIQQEAEVSKAEVVIATTLSDEVNILCCLVAQKSGVKHTIARIRNPEYSKQIDFLHKGLGLSMIVNPELEAAKEIATMLRFPSSTKIDFFANNQAEIVELKIQKESPFCGKSLAQIKSYHALRYLVAAIERNGKVLIPDGNTVLEEKDKAYLIASASEMDRLFRKIGVFKERSKNVMIIGGGKITFYLAKTLVESNVKVKIIEIDRARCEELSELLPEVVVINTDGTNQEDLLEEGIKNVDALVTLTGLDEENIVISLYAQTLNIPKVITKINHYSYTNILESVGLDSVISTKANTANRILRYIRSLDSENSELRSVYRLPNNQMETIEFYIEDKTDFTKIPFRKLPTKSNALIACIIRDKKVIIPDGNDWIEPGDSVIVVSTMESVHDFTDILKG